MKRYFLLLFCAYVVLNLCYTSYIYFESDKIEGRVSWTARKAEGIEFFYNGKMFEVTRSKWAYIQTLKEGDAINVLISNKAKVASDVEINSFFQFWFTFYDMIGAFSFCFIGTIILINIIPEKEKEPVIWK